MTSAADDPEDSPALAALTDSGATPSSRTRGRSSTRVSVRCEDASPPRGRAAVRSRPRPEGRPRRLSRRAPACRGPRPTRARAGAVRGRRPHRGRPPAGRWLSVEVGPRGRHRDLQRGEQVRALARRARPPALRRSRRRAVRPRTRHGRGPRHAESRAPVAGRGGTVPGTVKGTVFTVRGILQRALRPRAPAGKCRGERPRRRNRVARRPALMVSLPNAETLITGERILAGRRRRGRGPPVTVSLGPPATPGSTVARRAASHPPAPHRPRRSAAGAAGPPSSPVDSGTASSPTSTATASTRRSNTRPATISSRSPTRPDIDGAPSSPAPRSSRSGVVFPAPRAPSTRCSCSGASKLRAHNAPQAIAWYDEYLAHAPTGAYAAEALGRKMILTDEHDGRSAARPIATNIFVASPAAAMQDRRARSSVPRSRCGVSLRPRSSSSVMLLGAAPGRRPRSSSSGRRAVRPR